MRRLEQIDTTVVSTLAGAYRLSWLLPLIDQDRSARRQIRQLERDINVMLDEHGTTRRDEPGIGPIAAATRLDFGGNRRINSVLHIASVTQHRDRDDACAYIDRKLGEGKTRREARRAHKRNVNRVIRRMWKDETRRHRPPVTITA